MFKKRRPTGSGASGGNHRSSGCECIHAIRPHRPFDGLHAPAKKRVTEGAKMLLDIAKESADWFPPLKAALGGVNALIKHYEVSLELMAVAHD